MPRYDRTQEPCGAGDCKRRTSTLAQNSTGFLAWRTARETGAEATRRGSDATGRELPQSPHFDKSPRSTAFATTTQNRGRARLLTYPQFSPSSYKSRGGGNRTTVHVYGSTYRDRRE